MAGYDRRPEKCELRCSLSGNIYVPDSSSYSGASVFIARSTQSRVDSFDLDYLSSIHSSLTLVHRNMCRFLDREAGNHPNPSSPSLSSIFLVSLSFYEFPSFFKVLTPKKLMESPSFVHYSIRYTYILLHYENSRIPFIFY